MLPPSTDPGLRELASRLRRGELNLLDQLEEIRERIDAREPEIHALSPEPGRFERLRRQAEALAERHPQRRGRPPLFGVLVGVKEIFHVDGLPTTAGSRLPPGELAGPEAASVAALRRAGALVLGKTVSTEFAYLAPGPTRNPHNPEHTPGGSSSGSAAAVAAGFCPLALGSQTIGSISRPASFCGVVGFKPSYDRISRRGVVPLSPSLDHVGTLTADVAGAQLAAAILCDGWRPIKPQRGKPALGIPDGPYLERASPAALEGFGATCERLVEAGYRIERLPAMAEFEAIERRHRTLLAVEAAAVHRSWYERHRDLYHPKTRELIEQGAGISADEEAAARAGREELRQELLLQMRGGGVDLWISPAARGPAPSGLDSTGDPVMNLPWSQSGLPTLAIPAGAVRGLPLGLQVAAEWLRDEELLAWGVDLERAVRR